MTVVYGIYALQWDCSIPITPIANPKADHNRNTDKSINLTFLTLTNPKFNKTMHS